MSYCRFSNTEMALDECLDELNNGNKLSGEELESCKNMFRKFIDFGCNEGIVYDEDGELDDRLEDFFEGIKK